MKIIFGNESDKEQFKNWLHEVQGYVQQIEMLVNNPTIIEDEIERKELLSTNATKLWYRIYDVGDSLYEVIPNKTSS